jgi:23S rRNA pseudouridine1911/1915/1917 synthase
MNVIFVDNHLLVVNKPAGLPTQPHGPGLENLTDQAKAWVKRTYAKPGNVFLEPIHRLDKPVSGLVLFARTSKALSRLQEKMRERAFVKTYYALVDPTPRKQDGNLEHYLVHDEYRARVVTASHPEGKRARLSYKVIQDSLLEIDLETGRYHQIRAQFAAEGCPIIGDVKYGSTSHWKQQGIALHHGKLSVPHPVSHELMLFTCDAQWVSNTGICS